MTEKFVMRYRKQGYTQSQLDRVAEAFGAARGLRDCNCEVYNDFEEIAVFGKDGEGRTAEVTLPFAQLEKWLKKAETEKQG